MLEGHVTFRDSANGGDHEAADLICIGVSQQESTIRQREVIHLAVISSRLTVFRTLTSNVLAAFPLAISSLVVGGQSWTYDISSGFTQSFRPSNSTRTFPSFLTSSKATSVTPFFITINAPGIPNDDMGTADGVLRRSDTCHCRTAYLSLGKSRRDGNISGYCEVGVSHLETSAYAQPAQGVDSRNTTPPSAPWHSRKVKFLLIPGK